MIIQLELVLPFTVAELVAISLPSIHTANCSCSSQPDVRNICVTKWYAPDAGTEIIPVQRTPKSMNGTCGTGLDESQLKSICLSIRRNMGVPVKAEEAKYSACNPSAFEPFSG